MDTDYLRKQGKCVYLAAEESVADDLAKSLTGSAGEIDALRTRLQRAEELRDKWERHANAIPEADCVDSDYRQGFKDALMACVQDFDSQTGGHHDD